YGGTGRAARSWEAFDAIVESLRRLEDDETLLVQSGKPVGIFRTHPHAPRVLIANALLVPRWATWEHFRELEAQGLMMFGQMTAGSWIYIGSQGIVQGTFETFAEAAARHFGGTLAGRLVLTAGLGGMGGAQPLAVTMNGGVCLALGPRWCVTSRRSSRCGRRAAWCSTTATTCAARRSGGASSTRGRSRTRGSYPRTCGRCSAAARGRSGGPRCRAIRRTSRR